jgi:hypothetical protein
LFLILFEFLNGYGKTKVKIGFEATDLTSSFIKKPIASKENFMNYDLIKDKMSALIVGASVVGIP